MPATGPQNDLGTKLYWLEQARQLPAVARCMGASRYHISDRPAPFDLSAGADNTQMPDLPRITRTHEFVSLSAGRSGPTMSRAEVRALGTCQNKAGVPYLPLMRLGRPLLGSWWKIIYRIQSSARVRAAIPGLTACATRYGYPHSPYGYVPPPIRTFADFMTWIASYLDGAFSRGASMRTMAALDRHWRPPSSAALARS